MATGVADRCPCRNVVRQVGLAAKHRRVARTYRLRHPAWHSGQAGITRDLSGPVRNPHPQSHPDH